MISLAQLYRRGVRECHRHLSVLRSRLSVKETSLFEVIRRKKIYSCLKRLQRNVIQYESRHYLDRLKDHANGEEEDLAKAKITKAMVIRVLLHSGSNFRTLSIVFELVVDLVVFSFSRLQIQRGQKLVERNAITLVCL